MTTEAAHPDVTMTKSGAGQWRPSPALVEMVRQFLGYVAVSGAALAVDVSIYASLLRVLPYASFAAPFGYVFGVLTHYILSSRIVFRKQINARGLSAEVPVIGKFFAAGFTGLLVTTLTIALLADVMGVNPLIAKAIAAGMSFVAVFTSLRLFVFRSPAPR
ncbi:MAG: GtrA family protein [Hyphomicrobiaceae bacterium]|nr:GtrA family protein [Hyphomicrobiaceae bacterium]